ncbi:hypothetical protein IW261DRAFT_1501014, partial [Armillaria novae-zelandiae]
MKDFLQGGDESNGNEDYVGSATEVCNIASAQPHQLRSGREYGPDKSRLNNEAASKESPRPTSRDRESPRVIRSAISSANDSGSDELSIRGSTPRRTSSPDTQAQGTSRRRPPELGPTQDQAARAAYRVVSSSEDESRSPSPELERPVRRCGSFRN